MNPNDRTKRLFATPSRPLLDRNAGTLRYRQREREEHLLFAAPVSHQSPGYVAPKNVKFVEDTYSDTGEFFTTIRHLPYLHPNDAGYKAMADAIDLSLFGVKAR